MANMRPFRAIRANEALADRVAALPYDVYNREEAKKIVEKNPLSFLKIDRAETQFDDKISIYDEKVYQKAHDLLWDMVQEGSFLQDETPNYYIYEQIMNGRTQTGIVACASVEDYESGVIMKHENTRKEKEMDRIHHVDSCDAQTGPIFLAYHSDNRINEVVNRIKGTQPPIYDFISEDGIQHLAWTIGSEEDTRIISEQFDKMNHIYIADGHHRCASAVKVAQKRRKENPSHKGTEEYNYFLSVLFPDDQLMIMDYNRVIKDMGSYTAESLLTELEKMFVIEAKGNHRYRPERKGNMGMYLDNTWYSLQLREEYQSSDVVDGLDVSALQNLVLRPLFQIEDPKTDNRIDFVGGIRGLEELERRVHTDSKVAFAMYPTSIQELFAVADAQQLMPPKSTWFEPKLRSGLFIHDISVK